MDTHITNCDTLTKISVFMIYMEYLMEYLME
nr:MAG TPA: hypothetical protein [Caudoviricetes sp.]